MRRESIIADPEETFRTGVEAHQARLWTALPGIIEAVGDGELTVQPAVQGRITSRDPESGRMVDKFVDLPLLIHVPIVWPTGGGFALTFPLKAGDEVLVVFSSRAIDSWFQSGGVGAPVEARMHDLSDGFALVGVRSQATKLPEVSAEAVQLRNDAGTAFVEINDSGDLTLKTQGNITLEAGKAIELKAGTTLTLFAQVKLVLDSILIAFRTLAGMLDLGEHTHGGGSPPTTPLAEP